MSGEQESTVPHVLKKEQPRWFAAYTHPRSEKQVETRLLEAGVETFLPLQKTYRRWSDRKKLIEKPLINSYIFVRVIPKEFPKVFKVYGIVKFISFEGQPASIPDKQINNLRLLVNSDAELEVTSEKFEKGDNVEVTTGSLVGLTGELIQLGNKKRVLVRLDSLEKNIVVTIPVTFLSKVK